MKGSEKMFDKEYENRYLPFLNSNIDYYNNTYQRAIKINDQGGEPFVLDIEEATQENNVFRRSIWTGNYLQITLMSIKPGESIGLERHDNVDQFIRIESGVGLVKMGESMDNLNFRRKVYEDFAFVIPSGIWHDLVNIGTKPIKLYSIYAPPQHPKETVHVNKEDDKH